MWNIEQACPRGAMLGLLALAACSYDFDVGPDVPPADDVPVVGVSDEDAAAPVEAGSDAPVEAARTCATISSDLTAARTAAKACPTLTAACTAEVVDQCSCHVFVWADSEGAIERFQRLLAELDQAGCMPTGCNCLAGAAGRCLAAGGGAYACSP